MRDGEGGRERGKGLLRVRLVALLGMVGEVNVSGETSNVISAKDPVLQVTLSLAPNHKDNGSNDGQEEKSHSQTKANGQLVLEPVIRKQMLNRAFSLNISLKINSSLQGLVASVSRNQPVVKISGIKPVNTVNGLNWGSHLRSARGGGEVVKIAHIAFKISRTAGAGMGLDQEGVELGLAGRLGLGADVDAVVTKDAVPLILAVRGHPPLKV